MEPSQLILRYIGINNGRDNSVRSPVSLRTGHRFGLQIVHPFWLTTVASMGWAETAASMKFVRHPVENTGHGPGGDSCRGPRWR